jgi:hypothetical protein
MEPRFYPSKLITYDRVQIKDFFEQIFPGHKIYFFKTGKEALFSYFNECGLKKTYSVKTTSSSPYYSGCINLVLDRLGVASTTVWPRLHHTRRSKDYRLRKRK